MNHTIVKTLTNNLRAIAALPADQHPEPWFRKLARGKDEKASDYRKRALIVIGERWGYTDSMVRAMEEGNRDGKNAPALLRDVTTYGAVRFKKKGCSNKCDRHAATIPCDHVVGLIRSSLGEGMSASDYVLAAAERKRELRAAATA